MLGKFFGATWTPERRQGEHAECGLAALSIAMGFHGVHIPLHQLRRDAGSTLYGSTARVLRDLARRYGFAASAHRVEPNEMESLGFPLIAHSRFIHFVVVEKVSRAGIHINDPTSGPEIVPPERFSQDFTGIVIRLEAGAPSQGQPFSAAKQYFEELRMQWKRLMSAAVLSVFGVLLVGTAVMQLVPALRSALEGHTAMGWDWAALLVSAALVDWMSLRLVTSAAVGAARHGSAAMMQELPTWPASIYLLRDTGQSIARLSAPLSLVSTEPLVAGMAVLYLFVVMGIAVTLAPLPGLVLTLFCLAKLFVLFLISTRRGGAISRYGTGDLPHHSMPTHVFAHPDWWRIGQGGQNLFTRLAGYHALSAEKSMRAASAQVNLDGALRLLDLGLYGGLVLWLLNCASADTAAKMIGVLSLGGIAHLALERIRHGLHLLPLKNALHRLADKIDIAEPVPPRLTSPTEGLEFCAVSWRPAEVFATVLSDVSFSLRPGNVLTISASTGNSATAFSRLCAGLLTPSRGSAHLDGMSLAALPPGTAILLEHHTALLDGTLRDNLTLGADFDDAALRVALDTVGLWSALEPRGDLDLLIDDLGSALSGGQVRRLGLARALLRRPRILVLDGTLDSIEPKLAADIISRVRATGMMLIVISMREETLALGDQSLYLGVEVL